MFEKLSESNFTPEQVQVWFDYLLELEKRNELLLKTSSSFDNFLLHYKGTTAEWRKTRTKYLIYLLIIAGVLFIFIGFFIPEGRFADTAINFGAGIAGTAVTFAFIRMWENGETNFQRVKQLRRHVKGYKDEIQHIQEDTLNLKKVISTVFIELKGESEKIIRLDEQMIAHKTAWFGMIDRCLGYGKDMMETLDDFETNTKEDEQQLARAKSDFQKDLDELAQASKRLRNA